MKKLKIGVLGASGYVGGRIIEIAPADQTVPFSRTVRPGYRTIPPVGRLDFSGLDAVVNLSGEPILGLWTPEKKDRILRSRVEGTQRVVESMLAQPDGPRVLINASAVGFYGDTGEQEADERSPAGKGFLAETCQAWEQATEPAAAAGIRVVRLRIGFVIGPGGAMKLVLPVFRLGFGGNLGNGRQWMSCIHVDDVAGMILWAVENEAVSGAVNAVMPEPVRNAEFTQALASAVRRPAVFPAPAFALRFALGGLSAVMLDSVRVKPRVPIDSGYRYRFPDLSSAFLSLSLMGSASADLRGVV